MEENNVENKDISKGGGQNSQKQIVSAIIVAGIIIAGAILLKGSKSPIVNEPTVNNVKNTTSQVSPVSSSDHIVGSMNAKIVIVEYSDLECPFCKSFHYTMHQVVENSNDNVAWVFRHYPIPQLHPKAFHEAEATECATEQGGNDAFWKYTDRLFEITPSNNGLDVAELPRIAKDIGLNVTLFNLCLDSGKFKDKIQADIDGGVQAGVNGTPSSTIITKEDITTKTQNDILTALTNSPGAVSFSSTAKNTMSMNGALPVEMVNKILDVLLK